MRRKILITLLIVGTFILGTASTYFVLSYIEKDDSNINTNTCDVNIKEEGLTHSINKIYNAVAVIETYQGIDIASTGTGFVYKKDKDYGYIITNQHVVDGASRVEVTFPEEEPVEGEVLGGDVFADIAVLRVPVENISLIATIGDSSEISLGDTIFTVGTPLGAEYVGTVTKGIISGKERLVTVDLTGTQSGDWIMKVIQHDAAINPGNSGGPLLNINGEVIGINSLKFVEEEVEGMGFAIPIEYALAHVEKLEKGENIERPLLGVQLLDLNESYNIYKTGIIVDEDVKEGVLVEQVLKDSPAYNAGLKKGDVLQKIDEEKINNKAYLRYVLYKYDVGETITITYFRDDEVKTLEVNLNKSTNE